MEFKKLKEQALPLATVISKIKANTSQSYQWYAVKTKKGIFLEVGGNHQNIKAYIPDFIDGKYSLYNNGWSNHAYSVDSNGKIDYPSFYGSHKMDEQKLIEWLDNTNFKTYRPKIDEHIKIIEETYKTVKL